MRHDLLAGAALVAFSLSTLAATGALAPAEAGSTLGSRISAGGGHTCGVTRTFLAKCWGSNLSGELGDGTKIGRSIPVNVRRLRTFPGGITTGSSHTCARAKDNASNTFPWCWGANTLGQLGDGTTVGNVFPKRVRGLDPSGFFPVLASGTNHNCALTGSDLWCWGQNTFGQLGDGTKTHRSRPVKVQGLSGRPIDIALGNQHTCALTSAGRVECWGNNLAGQLGDGTTVERLAPVEVWQLKGVTSITAGYHHTCARTSSAIKCWGLNLYGQLGDGTTESRSLPAAVRGLAEGALHVAASEYHTCAVTRTNRAAMCWGRNIFGQLGDGTTLDRVKPRYVITLRTGVTALTAGKNHTCALQDNRIAKCWGSNSSGQLGDGTKTNRSIAVTVLGFN